MPSSHSKQRRGGARAEADELPLRPTSLTPRQAVHHVRVVKNQPQQLPPIQRQDVDEMDVLWLAVSAREVRSLLLH